MARRRSKTSPLEDVVGLVAQLPWWACLGAAVLSYWTLSALARPVPIMSVHAWPDPRAHVPVGASDNLHGRAVRGADPLPGGRGGVGRQAAQAQRLGGQRREPGQCEGAGRARWHELARLRAAGGRGLPAAGLRGHRTGAATGPDGGVDLVLRRDREKFLVQCKQWKAFKVGRGRRARALRRHGGRGGRRRFRRDVRNVHRGGDRLCQRPKRSTGRRAEALRAHPAGQGSSGQFSSVRRIDPAGQGGTACAASSGHAVCRNSVPERHQLPDLQRRHGASGGQTRQQTPARAFWGCMEYPACKGTRLR